MSLTAKEYTEAKEDLEFSRKFPCVDKQEKLAGGVQYWEEDYGLVYSSTPEKRLKWAMDWCGDHCHAPCVICGQPCQYRKGHLGDPNHNHQGHSWNESGFMKTSSPN